MSPISKAKRAYTSEKDALNCLLDQVATLLYEQNVGAKELEEAKRGCKVAFNVLSATFNGLFEIQCEEETQEAEMERFIEQEFEEWEQEFGNLEDRFWDLWGKLADAVAVRVRHEK